MAARRLEWDSDFFQISIGEVLESEQYLNDEFDFLIHKSVKDIAPIFPHYIQSYSEVKLTFNKKLVYHENLDSLVLDADDNPLDSGEYYPLAYESGVFSRYKLDKNMPSGKFEELYRLWINNTINKRIGDKLFYIIVDNKRLGGFVSLKLNQNDACIGLIAVDKDFRGHGLGKRLIFAAENYCYTNKKSSLNIPTQEINEIACNFYSNLGYNIKEKLNIKHYWKK